MHPMLQQMLQRDLEMVISTLVEAMQGFMGVVVVVGVVSAALVLVAGLTAGAREDAEVARV